jgi:hypothetical protein
MTDPIPTPPFPEDRLAILVLGMHRSGTSALTRLFGHLDLAMPDDGIDAHPDNAKGYWEPQALVAVDDRILRTARTSWFDPRPLDLARIPADIRAAHRAALRAAVAQSFGEAPRIAIKDPRLCRLVPLIAEALAEDKRAVRAVLMLRPPAAIARSLHRRDRSTPAYAHALWLRHMIDAERDSRALSRVVIDYDALLADWRAPMTRLAALADRSGWTPDTATAATIDDFLDPGLRHHAGPLPSGLEPHLERIVRDVELALSALVDCDDDAGRARLDAATHAFDADQTLLDDIIHDELRHRRFEELRLRAAHPEPAAEPEPEPEPEPIPDTPPPPAEPPRPVPPSLAEQVETIRASRLFDADWYVARYPDAAASGLDPVVHYLTVGAVQGHDPNPLFRTVYYAWQLARRDAAEAV